MKTVNRRDVSLGLLGLTATALSACTPTPRLLSAPFTGAVNTRSILVATNRADVQNYQIQFEAGRSTELSTLRYDISIPSIRKQGEYSFPRRDLDPEREFFVSRTEALNGDADFVSAVNADLARHSDDEKNLLLFVHGYNVSYPAAVFRAAQIAEDFDLDMPMALFSWPSAGRISRYAYDRDSALHARTALTDTLKMLAKTQARKITILAHSLGGLITMEALKRLTLQGDTQTLSRVDGVVLAQPDIDVDVFTNQVSDIDLDKHFVAVLASTRDRALQISSVLTGGHPRVGAAQNIEDLRKIGVIVLDVSEFATNDLLNHDTYVSSPALLSLISSGKLAERVIAGAPGQDLLIEGANLTGQAALAIAYLPYAVTGL
jgi:esterase/lipase superfamily enzyme